MPALKSALFFRVILLVVGVVVLLLLWGKPSRKKHKPEGYLTIEDGEVSPLAAGTEAFHTPASPNEASSERLKIGTTIPAKFALAEIRGRLVFRGGVPAAGVVCEVHGWSADQERQHKHGMPSDWIDLLDETDADGRFSISFDPPGAFQFTLEAKTPRFAGVEWRWSAIEPGAVVDVGEVTLLAGGTIEGRMVNGEGKPLLDQDWTVYARSIGHGEREGRDETQVMTDVDPSTGRYRAEDVMPGRVELQAYSSMANWVDGPPLTLRAGESLHVDIFYEGPDSSRRITVSTFSEPFYVMSTPDVEHIKLICPDGEIRSAEWIEGSSQSFSFNDLDPGVYRLEIHDPRFLPWSVAGVRPGADIDAQLQGSSTIAIKVVDPEEREVADYSVRVVFRNVNFFPKEFDVQPLLGLLEGLFPGDYTIQVRAGASLGVSDVDGLGEMETREVTIRVGSGASLCGRVIHGDGTPIAGVDVLLLQPATTEDSDRSPILRKDMTAGDESRFRKQLDSTSTDELGRFCFLRAHEGSYVVHAAADGSEVSSSVVAVSGGLKAGEETVLVLPHGSYLRGSVRGPSGEACSGFRVGVLMNSIKEHIVRRTGTGFKTIGVTAADGQFELGPIPAGSATVYICPPKGESRMESATSEEGSRNSVEIGRVTLTEGQVLEQDFYVREMPGSITLDLTVNGEPALGLQVHIRGAEGSGYYLYGETDSSGTLGTTQVFPSIWTVEVFSFEDGWMYTPADPVYVAPGVPTHAMITIDVKTAKVHFIDSRSGEPLTNRAVSALRDAFPFPLGSPRLTDSVGTASFTLIPGSYSFLLDPDGAEPKSNKRSAPIIWTLQGPLIDQVRL